MEHRKRKQEDQASTSIAAFRTPVARAEHVSSYSLLLAVLVAVRAYKIKQNDVSFNFTITLQDPQGGKFDDIVLRCASQKTAVYMQCKQKRPKDSSIEGSISHTSNIYTKKLKAEPSITARAFFCLHGPFSIPMYFISFLEMKPNSLYNDYYFLCTNAVIDDEIVNHFSKIEADPSMNQIFSCYTDLDGKFYEFNKHDQWLILNEKLKYASLSYLGKSLAKSIFHQHAISRATPIYNMYAVLVHSIIDRSDQTTAISSPPDHTILSYKFKEAFLLAAEATDFGKLREAFSTEYQKLLGKGKDKWKDIENKEIKMDRDFAMSAMEDAFKLINNESTRFAKIDEKITEFYSKFRLVCTPGEEKLRSNAKHFISKLTDTETEITFNSLCNSIFNVMVNSSQINWNYINGTFQKLKRNTCYYQLKTSTKEYTETLTQRFPHGLMNRKWLESSYFYQLLCNKLAYELHYYCSSVDLDFSAMIILETLNLLEKEYLFIHESNELQQPNALEEILANVFKYIEANLDTILYIIVVLTTLETVTQQLFNNLPKSHQQKLIVLTSLTEKGESSEKSLVVRDLAQEARNKLFLDNNQLHFFGTSTSISSVVQETDDLSFMLKVLDYYSETKATDKTNINLHNYEKIRNSYIQRDVETYSPSKTPDSYTNRDIKKCFEYLKKDSIIHQTYSFDEMMNTFLEPVCKPTYELVQWALSKPQKERHITDLHDKNNRNKCMVLLDRAGFGKTMYFTWLAWRLSVLNDELFVVKLNAIEYSSEFDELQNIQNQIDDDSELVRILYRFVSLALDEPNLNKRFQTKLNEKKRELAASLLCFTNGQVEVDESKAKCLSFEQLLELRLFCSKFNAKQLVLLFDAYDEIFPDYTDIVIKCFAGFNKFDGIRNIYFSSRPQEFQDSFKNSIKNYKMFQLKPFSHDHQILSLHKLFLNEVNEYKNLETNYQSVVLGVVYTVLINRVDDLVKAPLLLHLAFDAFLPVIKQNVFFSEKTISSKVILTNKFQTFDIVKFFIERKLEILNTEKSGSTDTGTRTVLAQRKNQRFIQRFQHSHAIMAIYVLFDKSYVNTIISHRELLSIMEDIEQEEGKAGIIVEVKNNIPLFTHRTFAEYMAALWLFKNKDKLRTDPYFKSHMFWMRGFARIRYFFDQMIVREYGNSKIYIAVLNKSLEEVKEMIENDSSLVALKDAGGRIPLLLALQHDSHEVMLYLLEKMSSINVIDLINKKDYLFHWNALDYAFAIWNKNAIKALLEFGASIDIVTLQDQLCSNTRDPPESGFATYNKVHNNNDTDNLLIQAYHYINQIETADDRRKLSIWTVDYLCNYRKVDVNDQRERLEHSTILQYCVKKNAYELFEQFILHLDNPGDFLSSMGHHLIQAALAKNAYDIVCFLLDEFLLHPPKIKNQKQLFAAIRTAIELGRIVSLQTFLDQLCSLFNINCASNSSIAVSDLEIHIQPLNEDQMPKSCCVRKNKSVLLPMPEYNEPNVLDKDHLFESLLALAAHEGNVHIMSYIVHKFQKPITNTTIVMVMRLLPKGKRLIHNQSLRAFKFLLDRTTDLESVDEYGRNLLHMIIQNGCFFMVQCLLDIGFDRTLINEKEKWNIFHYIAASESRYTNRAFKLYQLLKSLEPTDYFDSVDKNGNSVYETAVLHYNFDIARDMIERIQIDPVITSKRVEFVIETVERLVGLLHELEVLEYLKYLFEFGDIAWMETYSRLRKCVPII